MKFNNDKSKVMLSNPCHSLDFMPEILLQNHQLDVVEELKFLGAKVRPDFKWSSNTEYIIRKAYRRLRRMKNLGVTEKGLLDTYKKQVRSVLELANTIGY